MILAGVRINCSHYRMNGSLHYVKMDNCMHSIVTEQCEKETKKQFIVQFNSLVPTCNEMDEPSNVATVSGSFWPSRVAIH